MLVWSSGKCISWSNFHLLWSALGMISSWKALILMRIPYSQYIAGQSCILNMMKFGKNEWVWQAIFISRFWKLRRSRKSWNILFATTSDNLFITRNLMIFYRDSTEPKWKVSQNLLLRTYFNHWCAFLTFLDLISFSIHSKKINECPWLQILLSWTGIINFWSIQLQYNPFVI